MLLSWAAAKTIPAVLLGRHAFFSPSPPATGRPAIPKQLNFSSPASRRKTVGPRFPVLIRKNRLNTMFRRFFDLFGMLSGGYSPVPCPDLQLHGCVFPVGDDPFCQQCLIEVNQHPLLVGLFSGTRSGHNATLLYSL